MACHLCCSIHDGSFSSLGIRGQIVCSSKWYVTPRRISISVVYVLIVKEDLRLELKCLMVTTHYVVFCFMVQIMFKEVDEFICFHSSYRYAHVLKFCYPTSTNDIFAFASYSITKVIDLLSCL